MRTIHTDELKQIQLQLLKQIDAYCTKNNLQYFLAYGTLIGAIRHQGFIPWDDDIDIVMPRSDYDQFVAHFNQENPHSKVISMENTPQYGLPFAKVHDTRTVMHETMYKQDNFGVYIDVFPLDGIMKATDIDTSLRWNKFLNAKKAIIDHQRSLIKNIIILGGKIALTFKSTRSILKTIDTIARKTPWEQAQKVAQIASPYGRCEIVEKDVFSTHQMHTFEDYEFRIPTGYHQWLTNIYGDYMQLPPVEKRVSTHTFEAWWK